MPVGKNNLSERLNLKRFRQIDKTLLIVMLLIVCYGILNIYIATKGGVFPVLGPYYFAKKQLIWFIISIVAMLVILFIDYKTILRFAPALYVFSIILLLFVWVPGIGKDVNGGTGWIDLKIGLFQPSELAKITMTLMVAKKIDEFDGNINNLKNMLHILLYAAIPMILILLEKDMGMTMVSFFMLLGMLYIAGLDRRIIIGGFTLLVVGITIAWNTGLILEHQKSRLTAFMNQDADDVSSDGYQLNQGIIGIGNGGLGGVRVSLDADVSPGYAGSNVPEVQTDFIFSAVAEQWGFIGAVFLLVLYAILIIRMILIAKRSKERDRSIVCIGIVSYFLYAITQNIGMTLGLMPITGITLPLVSYGGTSLLFTVIAVALVLNIGMNNKKIIF